MKLFKGGSENNLEKYELIMVCAGGVIITILITTMSILTKRQLERIIQEEQKRLVNERGVEMYGAVVRE